MPKTKKKSSSSDSDSGPDDRAPPPKSKKVAESSRDEDKSGANNQWILEKTRQIRINEFRGRKLIDIREYYEKNGEMLPGKKGISLTTSQWRKLLEVAEEVSKAAQE